MFLFTTATGFPQNVLDVHFNLGHTNVKVKIYSSYYCVKWDILRPSCIELSKESQKHFPPSINRKQKQSPMTTIALLMKIVSTCGIYSHFSWIRAKWTTASLQLLIFVVDNTASIELKQGGFSTERSMKYVLEIEISDGGTPEQKSINLVQIKVCTCQTDDGSSTAGPTPRPEWASVPS